MRFKENDTVRVVGEYENDIRAGDIGTVVMVFTVPTEAYEVEFLDENGYPIAQKAMLPANLELVE